MRLSALASGLFLLLLLASEIEVSAKSGNRAVSGGQETRSSTATRSSTSSSASRSTSSSSSSSSGRGVAVRPPEGSSGGSRGASRTRSGRVPPPTVRPPIHYPCPPYCSHWPGWGWGWGWYWGWPYWSSYWGPYWGSYWGPVTRVSEPLPLTDRPMGSLDLNVRPKDTAVYVDGGYVGIAGNYDGYPGYLWLDEGLHQVVLYKSGYETLTQDYRIIPGNRIKAKHKMQKGIATAPEELFKPPPVIHEGKVQDPPGTEIAGPEEWRQRAPRPIDTRTDTGGTSLHIDVEPDQASIYLDGRFLGIGGEVVSLAIEPGAHRIEVIYPGREPQTRDFEARAGEDVDIQIVLQAPEG